MKNSRQLIRFALILIVAGVGWWQRDKIVDSDPPSQNSGTAVLKEGPIAGIGKDPAENPEQNTKVNGYDMFTGARLLERDGNDGDSFFVKAGNREIELRLYFVDAPEKYISDRYENQQRRVSEQAREMGWISDEQVVEVGKAAKMFMEQELGEAPFTVYTYWEKVFDGDRYYGFVELADGEYLSTKLIERGLARIHTKGPGSKQNPVPTPDGASFFDHRDMLEDAERDAKKAKRGAWSL